MSAATAPHATWSRADLWGPAPAPRPFGALDLGAGVLALIVAQVVIGGGALAIELAGGTDPADVANTTFVLLTGMASMWAVFLGWPAVAARRVGTAMRDLIGPWAMRHGAAQLRVLGWAVAVALMLRALSIGVDLLAAHLGWGVEGNSGWMTAERAWWASAAVLLGGAVVGPIAEEVFFRGLALRSIAASLTRRARLNPRVVSVTAIVLSSIAFGLPHASTVDASGALTSPLSASGIYVLAQTTLIGAALGVIAVRKGLAAACAAHVTFNSVGVLLMVTGVAS
ncbi:CPBP family intramembrane glutamic endopeptidase [Cellulosimicrobium sp. Marseille-Q4280]|uniref:CPBP family intramembrane glutamic endopeptidase n=1 Tax=Cellulosimicrobium sp. Marseille-Q4280 TaxID=2937992 RepID=UPI00203C47BB|nr:CPBP family intramembrane glutamic endopeptidase [Cellulosimicrobium sp. Marseille-Q4280]